MDLESAVEAADLAAIIRGVDALCAAGDWDGLWALRKRCRDAEARGKPLFAVLTHIDYRIALEAPAAYAARVLVPGAGRYGPGPLSEVAASTHAWAELDPLVEDPLVRAALAQERVLRGEILDGLALPHLELPLRLLPWEPAYPGVTYLAHEVQEEVPELPAQGEKGAGDADAEGVDAPRDAVDALRAAAAHWEADSAGTVRAAGAAGGVRDALRVLGIPAADDPGRVAVVPISAADALARIAWAAATGAKHGGRRGGAAGRFAAWWAAAGVAGVDWPPDGDEFGDALGDTAWFRWLPVRGDEPGWVFRIAVLHSDGFAIAVDAVDAP